MRLRRGPRVTAVIAALGTAAATAALVTSVPAAQAAAPIGGEVISHGGFENDLWTPNESATTTVVTDQKHAGARSIKATGRGTTGSGPSQQLGGKMSAGTTYALSYWIYYDAAAAPATKNFWATARYASAQKNEYGPYNLNVNLVQAVNVPKGTWTQVTGSFTIPADRTDVSQFRLFFETPYTATPTAANDLFDFYVDDVTLTEQGATRNLVSGGDFENVETAPWSPRNGGVTVTRTTAEKASGASSLLVAGRTDSTSGAIQSVPVEAGASYDASFKVKYTDTAAAASLPFNLTADFGSAADGSQYVQLITGTVPRGAWTTVSGRVTIPTGRNLSQLRVYVENNFQAAGFPTSFYLDDVSMKKVTAGSPVTPPAPVAGDQLERNDNTAPGSFGAFAKTPGTDAATRRGNPLVTQNFGADPWAMEVDGRVYVYTTNDTQEWANHLATGAANSYGRINQINVWSSADMINWTNHGSIDAAGPTGITRAAAGRPGNSWAPAAASKDVDGDGDEEFFLYFANSAGGIWVLKGESPTGPFTSPRNNALVGFDTPGVRGNSDPDATDVVWLFDPAVLVDDDGQAYLYFGGGVPTTGGGANDPDTARVAKLGPDMTSLADDNKDGAIDEVKLINAPAIFEDSGIHKVGDTYYYTYCTNFSHTLDAGTVGFGRGDIVMMESKSPMGPWSAPKLVFPNQQQFFGTGTGGNNHHSFFTFKDQWYLTYHAATLDAAIQGPSNAAGFRNAQIEPVTLNPDGSVQQVKGTYAGPGQLATLDPYAGPVSADTIAWQAGTRQGYEGTATFEGQTPVPTLTSVNTKDWTSLAGVDFGSAGLASIRASVLPRAGGTITVRSSADQSTASNVLATMTVPAGAGTTWSTVSATVPAGALTGVKDVFFTYSGAEGVTDPLFDVRDWTFSRVGGNPVVTPPVVTPPVVTPPVTTPPVVTPPVTPPGLEGNVKGKPRAGKPVKIVVTMDVDGVVTIKAAGKKKTVKVTNGKAKTKLRFPRPGTYTVVIKTAGEKVVQTVQVVR